MTSTDLPVLDFRNAVEQMATPEVEKKPLLPIFEAIHNSIQSIQEANRDHGDITIDITRNQNDLDPKAITTISITDNGLGFTTQNKKSFGRLFTTHKKESFNCKGIGRLSFFSAFNEVMIHSTFEENGTFHEIKITLTDKNFNDIINTKPNDTNSTTPKTRITITNPKTQFNGSYKITSETIQNEVLNHFLPSLLSIKNVNIIINDNGKFNIGTKSSDVSAGTSFIIDNNKFDIYHIKNRTPHRATHKIILSADGRSVKEKKIDFLPGYKIGDNDDKHYINSVVISEYLNKKLNHQRSDFNIPESSAVDQNTVTLDKIYKKASEQTRTFAQTSISALEEVLDKLIDNTFEDLPHLSFLKDDASIRNSIKLGEDQKSIKDRYIREFAEKQVESFNYVKIISKKYENKEIPNFDTFKKESLEKLNNGMKLNHAPLISYIKYRNFVLNLYEKLLEKKEDGKFQHEEILHNLLFPTKQDSTDCDADYFKHNLWIIDDRYALYDFLTSDLYEKSTLGKQHERSDKRYDICAAYSDPLGEDHNIFIIELKKTSLELSESNDPIAQIKNYVQRMIHHQKTKHNGKRIKITESTQFYGLVLCDTYCDYFKDYMISGHSLKKRPDGKSFYSVLLNDKFFLEITNYENLLSIAHSRNRVFIDKLNHN